MLTFQPLQRQCWKRNVWLTSMREYKVVGVQCINSGNAAGVQTAGLTSNVMNNVSKELNNDTFLYFSRI